MAYSHSSLIPKATMLFKDLKSGFPVYIYNRNSVELQQGKVVNDVGLPHIDSNYKLGSMPSPNMSTMVVDVIVECDGNVKTYTFKDNMEIGYAGDLVIATDKSQVLREVEAAAVQSEEHISKTEFHQTRLDKCKKLLIELNPAIKEKQQMDNRLSALEEANKDNAKKLGNIESMLASLMKEFKS